MNSIVLVNGKKRTLISTFDRLVQFGDGVFETCVFNQGGILFWSLHFARLENGRTQLKINAVSNKQWLKDIAKAVSMANTSNAVVKIILSRGESLRGYGFNKNIKPTRIVIVSAMAKKTLDKYRLTTCNSGYVSNQLLANIKHCNRLEQILARADMSSDECLMLDANNHVISTTQSNIFIIQGNELLTPSLAMCGIQGTRRALVLEIAKTLGLAVSSRALSVQDLLDADEVFITNSVIGIQSVSKINQQTFTTYLMTDKIRRAFLKLQTSPEHTQVLKLKHRFVGLKSKKMWLVILLFLFTGWFYYLKDVNAKQSSIYQLPAGATIHTVADDLQTLGQVYFAKYVVILAKLLNIESKLKHGYYQITPGMSVAKLLNNFATAKVATTKITLIEGQTIRHYYQQLRQSSALTSNGDFAQTLQLTGVQPPYEGYFWADTYQVSVGDSVLSVLKRAYRIMQYKLRLAWQGRAKNLALKSADEALILASLIEKETAYDQEKSQIAGVFMRRLQKGMRLQADSTVVYALGEQYRGSLSRQDLKFDSPYNTYRYQGLPPSPIASVSEASLIAAMHPKAGESLYFVAKKDGTHAFAKTYQQHRLNIKKYLK